MKNGTISLLIILQIVFLILKFCGVITGRLRELE